MDPILRGEQPAFDDAMNEYTTQGSGRIAANGVSNHMYVLQRWTLLPKRLKLYSGRISDFLRTLRSLRLTVILLLDQGPLILSKPMV